MADTFKGIVTADGKKRQLPYRNILDIPISDPSLTVDGGFADAAAVGKKNKKTDEEIASLKEDLTEITEPSINLFDVSTLVRPGYYRGNGDVATENELSEYCTDYVPVESEAVYTWSALENGSTFMISTYNANREVIERKTFQYTTTSVVFDSDVKFIRFSIINKFFTNEFMFVKGTELPRRYVHGGRIIPYEVGFDLTFAEPISNIDLNTFQKNGTFSYGGASNVKNIPYSGQGGFLLNHYADSNYRWYQLTIPYDSNDKRMVLYRVKHGDTWTDWNSIATFDAPVSSVNGKTGSVVLTALDVGALPKEDSILNKSVNLFNYNDLVDGYLYGDGETVHTDGISTHTQNFIPVNGGESYIWSKGNLSTIGVLQIMINTYDSSKKSIERFVTYATGNRYNSMKFDSKVSYVKISDFNEKMPEDFMFVRGTELPNVFIEYGNYIPESLIRPFFNLLNNMKVLWFGDSISMLRFLPHRVGLNLSIKIKDCSIAGAPFIASKNEDYQALGVLSQIQAKTGDGTMAAQYSAISNLARDGSWTDETKKQRTDNIDSIRDADMENEINTVVILAGTNDHNSDIPIDVFKTGIKTAIETLLNAYPHIELYIISPPWRGDKTANNIGKTLEDYVMAEKEIAEAYQIPFYDLYHSCGINTQNQGYFLNADKLHPSEKGDIMIAKKCARWLASN